MTWLAPRGGLPEIPLLAALAPEVQGIDAERPVAAPITAVVGWNHPAHRTAARRVARSRNLPLLILDDGLLASPRLRHRPIAPISLTCVGVEAGSDGTHAPGCGEPVLEASEDETLSRVDRAAAGIALIRQARIGGVIGASAGAALRRQVLVDATAAATPAAAAALFDQALARFPAATLCLILDDKQLGTPLAARARAAGCVVASADTDSWSLLETATAVFTLGGPLGLLALIVGRTVHCSAPTAYSGWGLTEDAAGLPRRGADRSLAQLVAAQCLQATRYADPFRNRASTFEDTAALLADWRVTLDRNGGIACCYGIDFWKRDRTRDFFLVPAAPMAIARDEKQAFALAAATAKAIAYWPQRRSMARFEEAARQRGAAVIRIEDGFIRSVGLGTNLILPASIVADSRGIYYDPTRQSDLEVILAETEFDPALLARAERLAAMLVDRRITKYNLAEDPVSLTVPEGQRRILVPGQFEDDKSVLLGGAGIATNEELLRRVRAANPDAFIIYKPHPDVESGHRKGIVANEVMSRLADAVVRRTAILSLIDWADEIHTLTSQTGFEALLRRRRVVTYGQPYYAGWGLTQDHNPVARRQRSLSLPELVAGTLILYPRYVDPVTRLPCGPEVVIDRIADPKTRDSSRLSRLRELQGMIFAQAKEWGGRLRSGRRI
jgi:capsular polysaccharide export protein